MTNRWVLGLVVLLAAGTAWAEDADVGALLKERVAASKAIAAIRREQNNANAAVTSKANSFYALLETLRGPVKTPEQVKSIEDRIQQNQAQLEALKVQMAADQQRLELAKITDPAARAAKLEELTKEQKAAQEVANAAAAPFNEKVKAVQDPLLKTDAALSKGLAKFFRDGTGTYACKTDAVSFWSANGTGQARWNDAAGKQQVAWASLFLDPEAGKIVNTEKIDGKYSISSYGTDSMWVIVGPFKIALSITNKAWQGDKAKLVEVFKNLVDLDGLAGVKWE